MKEVAGLLSGGGRVIRHFHDVFPKTILYIVERKGWVDKIGGGTSVCNGTESWACW